MRKTITLSLVALMVLSMSAMVMAQTNTETHNFVLNLLEKNPQDWSVVTNGASGTVVGTQTVTYHFKFFTVGDRHMNGWFPQTDSALTFNGKGLEPLTDYTLIYYGYDGINDVFPYATCIAQRTSTQYGRIYISRTLFDFGSFFDDGVAQKIWLVKSSDVDCNNHKMVAWNPTQYLFEQNTL